MSFCLYFIGYHRGIFTEKFDQEIFGDYVKKEENHLVQHSTKIRNRKSTMLPYFVSMYSFKRRQNNGYVM